MSQFAYDPFLDEDMNGSITKWEENQIEMQKYKRHIRETTRSLPIKSSTDGIEISHDNFHDLHFCFVVNGWKGVLNGISYMKHQFDVHPITAGSVTYRNTEMKKTTVKMIHHAVRCNAGIRGTSDGIAGGGDRVSNEILQTIQKYIQQNYKPYHSVNLSNGATEYGEFVSSISLNGEREDPSPIKLKITISFFGISLGGIYSRYAVGKLYEKLHSKESDNSNENSMVFPMNFSQENITEDITTNVSELDTTIHVPVYFNTYVSHLSPHLGLKENTYIALNSFGENLMAKCTGPTGRDAFLKTSAFYDLATCGKYLEPLSFFHKRIAFSNSHHTDLMVTTNSGGFLHPGSSYPHHPIPLHDKYTADLESKDSKNILTSFSPKYLAGCYVTLPDNDILTSIKNKPEKDSSNKLIDMSNALDSLGWTKIFFECRDMTATIRLPSRRLLCFLQSIPKPDNGKFITTKHQQQQITNGDTGDEEEMMSKILTSQQLSHKLNNNADGHHSSAYWYIPESHALLTTRSKGRFTCVLSCLYNASHRPENCSSIHFLPVCVIEEVGGTREISGESRLCVEPPLPKETFQKFSNNTGYWDDTILDESLLRFTLWSRDITEGYLMVTDLQGVKKDDVIYLTDPVVLFSDITRFGHLGEEFMKRCTQSTKAYLREYFE